jgi:hypothetical protein
MILAIDPGPEQSAYVELSGTSIRDFGKMDNAELLRKLDRASWVGDHVAIEMIASYGMPVGAEVFETCVWIGRFMQACGNTPITRIPRLQVKNNLCHSSRANDANIRQALIDRFGGKERAIGKKAAPGPLFGVSGDVWAALAVGLTWMDQNGVGTSSETSEGKA